MIVSASRTNRILVGTVQGANDPRAVAVTNAAALPARSRLLRIIVAEMGRVKWESGGEYRSIVNDL